MVFKDNSVNQTIIYGTLAYSFVTFPLAVIWHVLLFKSEYEDFGYFTGEPSFLLGLTTIIIQGFILSLLYPLVKLPGNGVNRGIKYSAIVGGFFWTSHVLAFLAKQTMLNPIEFLLMESFYLVLQFGIFGLCLGLLFKNQLDKNA